LVHGVGAEVINYKALVRHLPQDLPVYGLQGEGVDLPAGTTLRIESMAARYLSAMREVQAEGPYAVGGYSAGAVIAYEIARQIRAGGQEVELLVMLDGDSPVTAGRAGGSGPSKVTRFTRNLGTWIIDDLLASSAVDLKKRVESKARVLRGRLISRSSGGNEHRAVDVRDRFGVHQVPQELVPWLEACAAALDSYRPGRYTGKIVLLRARTSALLADTTLDRGWGRFADGGVEVRTIRGDHATILREPHVRELAQELTACLEASRERPFGPVTRG
jgi:thioesterase domain-containing protein